MGMNIEEVRDLLSKARPDLTGKLSTCKTTREIHLLLDLIPPPLGAAFCPMEPPTRSKVPVWPAQIGDGKLYEIQMVNLGNVGADALPLAAIKAVRKATNWPLKDCKDFCDKVAAVGPQVIAERAMPEETRRMWAELKWAGIHTEIYELHA